MIHQQLLRRAVAGRDPALVDFVETLAPRLLERFTTIPALGGSGQRAAISDPCLPDGLARHRDEELERFSHNFDQSLTTHILNGLFAGMRMAEELPPDKSLSDIEKRLWVMGYIVHDYTKVYGVKVDAGQLDTIRQVVRCLGKDLGFDAYLPDWLNYLDDVVFLAQNTQKVEGANLNLRDYRLRTRLRRLEKMRMLCSYADVLVHVRTPSEVMLPGSDGRNRAVNLGKTLDDLFGTGQAPHLAYHKLTEVRGLLSNLVNNVVMAELKAQGYQPYLFFPDGVVYLAAPGVQASVGRASVAETVWERVVDIISESENFGIKPWTTGFLVSSALYTIAGLSGVLDAGRRRAMRLTSNKSSARLYGFFTGKSENDLKKQFDGDMERVKAEQESVVNAQGIPSDGRVHKLGEFLTMVYREVRNKYKKAPDISPLLLKTLEIDNSVTSEETRQQKGGTYFGWFYAAARFIQANPGLDENSIDDTMKHLSKQVLVWVEEQDLEAKDSAALKDAVCKYVSSLIVVDGSQLGAAIDVKASFAQELNRYTKAKVERRPQCSLCSTPFGVIFQEATEVPFANQQYSNKSPLSVPMLVRGVCPACRVEMILRLVQQEGATEGNKSINLYLYPTYFFTLETERVAKSFVIEMRDLDVFALRQHLRDEGFSLNAFLCYEDFLGDETMQRRGVRTPRYREDEPAGLVFTSLTPLGRKPTDTDAWIIPALLSVGISLLLDVKVVASPSFVPLFPSGADFRETVILDGPHTFTQYVWGTDRFRVNGVEQALIRLLELYDLHLDVFSERRKPHWTQINAIVKDIVTDPYYVFSYYERKERSQRAKKHRGRKGGEQPSFKGISPQDIERYMEIYYTLGGETDMGIIGKLVDAYAAFYRADWKKLDSAYAVLRPFGTALDVVVKSDPRTEQDDLILLVAGSVNDDQERVRADQAEGFDPIVTNKSLGSYPERLALSRQRIEEFATICVDDLFAGYCRGDRAVLRERTNRLRSAARFYYLKNYGYQK